MRLKTLERLQQSSKEEKLDFLLKRCTVSASYTHVVISNLGLCPSHLSKQIFLKEASEGGQPKSLTGVICLSEADHVLGLGCPILGLRNNLNSSSVTSFEKFCLIN